MIVKLLTEHHSAFLGLKGGYRGSSEYTLVKMSHCWKSHAAAQMLFLHYVGSKSFSSHTAYFMFKMYISIFIIEKRQILKFRLT